MNFSFFGIERDTFDNPHILIFYLMIFAVLLVGCYIKLLDKVHYRVSQYVWQTLWKSNNYAFKEHKNLACLWLWINHAILLVIHTSLMFIVLKLVNILIEMGVDYIRGEDYEYKNYPLTKEDIIFRKLAGGSCLELFLKNLINTNYKVLIDICVQLLCWGVYSTSVNESYLTVYWHRYHFLVKLNIILQIILFLCFNHSWFIFTLVYFNIYWFL